MSFLPRSADVLPSQTSFALDWLKRVDRLDTGPGGHIPLCAAVSSSLGLASLSRAGTAGLAGRLASAVSASGRTQRAYKRGQWPLASIGL